MPLKLTIQMIEFSDDDGRTMEREYFPSPELAQAAYDARLRAYQLETGYDENDVDPDEDEDDRETLHLYGPYPLEIELTPTGLVAFANGYANNNGQGCL